MSLTWFNVKLKKKEQLISGNIIFSINLFLFSFSFADVMCRNFGNSFRTFLWDCAKIQSMHFQRFSPSSDD